MEKHIKHRKIIVILTKSLMLIGTLCWCCANNIFFSCEAILCFKININIVCLHFHLFIKWLIAFPSIMGGHYTWYIKVFSYMQSIYFSIVPLSLFTGLPISSLNMLFTYFWVNYNIVKLQTCISLYSWAIATFRFPPLNKFVVAWKLLFLQHFL